MSATQLIVNTIRYGSDVFEFQDKAVAEANNPWYIHDIDRINNFTITPNLPAGSDVRFLFKVASKEALNLSEYKLYKLNAQKKLTAISGDPTIATVLSQGNTVNELKAMNDIPDFLNKKVLPVIGLSTNTTGKNIPSVNFYLNAEVTQNHTTHEEESGITSFGKIVTIKTCDPEFVNSGNASVEIKFSMRNNGVWHAWKNFSSVKGSSGDAIRFKYLYRVGAVGGQDQACVAKIKIRYA